MSARPTFNILISGVGGQGVGALRLPLVLQEASRFNPLDHLIQLPLPCGYRRRVEDSSGNDKSLQHEDLCIGAQLEARRLWLRFAERYLQPAQIDAVDLAAIEALLPPAATTTWLGLRAFRSATSDARWAMPPAGSRSRPGPTGSRTGTAPGGGSR